MDYFYFYALGLERDREELRHRALQNMLHRILGEECSWKNHMTLDTRSIPRVFIYSLSHFNHFLVFSLSLTLSLSPSPSLTLSPSLSLTIFSYLCLFMLFLPYAIFAYLCCFCLFMLFLHSPELAGRCHCCYEKLSV